MNVETRELLEDILQRCTLVKTFTQDHSFESYQHDEKTRLAVERCFEIIGEALTRLSKIDSATLESIRDYRAIRSFRNVLAHAYDQVEDKIVWGILENYLDNLIEDVQRLL